MATTNSWLACPVPAWRGVNRKRAPAYTDAEIAAFDAAEEARRESEAMTRHERARAWLAVIS